MKTLGNVVLFSTAIVCPAALAISIYPGVLNDLLFSAILLGILVIPVIAILALVALIVFAYLGKLKYVRPPWAQAAVVFAILSCTFLLLLFYVPRRIAFAASRTAFEELVPQAVEQATHLNRRVGVFEVDDYAADPRGGVYFRVYQGADGIGPDRMSYGFVANPNSEGTPFGAARYCTFSLGHNWHWFCASDDYY